MSAEIIDFAHARSRVAAYRVGRAPRNRDVATIAEVLHRLVWVNPAAVKAIEGLLLRYAEASQAETAAYRRLAERYKAKDQSSDEEMR